MGVRTVAAGERGGALKGRHPKKKGKSG